MDKSFQGLLFSLIIHAILVWVLLRMDSPELFQNETTEITLIEANDKKRKSFVTETEDEEKDISERLKEEAALLSQFTKRVKEQMRAREFGPTKNRPESAKTAAGDPEGIAGERQRGQGDGFLAPGSGQAMRQVVIGPSSIAEFIPGVDEGSFTALNTDQFTYYAFFNRMNEQVRNRWINLVRHYMSNLNRRDLEVLSRRERQTTVEIVLSPAGEFQGSLVHITSGDGELDQTTVEAFRMAAPFLNPPQGMIESDGLIRLRYAFIVRLRPPSLGPAIN